MRSLSEMCPSILRFHQIQDGAWYQTAHRYLSYFYMTGVKLLCVKSRGFPLLMPVQVLSGDHRLEISLLVHSRAGLGWCSCKTVQAEGRHQTSCYTTTFTFEHVLIQEAAGFNAVIFNGLETTVVEICFTSGKSNCFKEGRHPCYIDPHLIVTGCGLKRFCAAQ